MKISILGSTGSIGTSTLEVIDKYSDDYEVAALAAGNNTDLLTRQIEKFKPRLVCIAEDAAANIDTATGCLKTTEIVTGSEGLDMVATLSEADIVVAAISGSAGLLPALAAVKAGKTVALANKEALVMAGEIIVEEARKKNCRIIPVDSEHSAIFQLLEGRSKKDVKNIILTASGGPFLNTPSEELDRVTPEEALNHPRWKMGNKVTTDSATLMNKGLEIIEAHWLFKMPGEKIKVVIHPESIIHSMIEFVDGTVLAQLSPPDMKGPIAYALSCPERLDNVLPPLDFARIGKLTFSEPDQERFPAIKLAYRALKEAGLSPAVLNAANEVAVEEFHKRRIRFTSIPVLVEKVMDRFSNDRNVNIDNVMWSDRWARREAEALLNEVP